MKKKLKEFSTKQKRDLVKKIDKFFDSVIEDYYLFIPTVILNESINLEGFKDKSKIIYNQIRLIKELKKEIKKL